MKKSAKVFLAAVSAAVLVSLSCASCSKTGTTKCKCTAVTYVDGKVTGDPIITEQPVPAGTCSSLGSETTVGNRKTIITCVAK